MTIRVISKYRCCGWLVALLVSGSAWAGPQEFRVAAMLKSGGVQQELKSWSITDLSGLKQISTHEKSPDTGKLVQWKGVLLSALIDQALSGLPAERKAQIDLVLLRNDVGRQALVPRAFIVKYPMYLALSSGKKGLGGLGPVYSVVPWTTNSRIMSEGVPVETFFVSGIRNIELTNYREYYGNLYLKRRTDPAAMRGEKIFVKNCVLCHVTGGRAPAIGAISEEARTRALSVLGHKGLKGAPQLSERERRAVVNYLDAYRLENSNPPGVANVAGPVPASGH